MGAGNAGRRVPWLCGGRIGPEHVLGAHFDVGWRLHRAAWGQGFATEAARAALEDAFERLKLAEVLAYTEAGNARSIAVMERLGLARDPARDFVAHYDEIGDWHGMVWAGTPTSR